MKLVAGNSNRPLAEAVAQHLKIPLARCSVRRFADMEVFVEIQENVRGQDVFVLQSTSFPANDHLMELLIIIDALRRSSAKRITAVMPYFGYARQDRRAAGRTPISAKLVANMITHAGADRVLTLDLHAGQIQGFFDIPTDNLFAAPLLARDVRERYDLGSVMVVSPDVGGVVRARALAKRIDAQLAIVDKRRERPGESEVMNIIGDVSDKDCILVDDIVDFRRHAVQRRRGADRQGRALGRRLHHARRALGRRGVAHLGLAVARAGDHGFDPADRSGEDRAQHPGAADRSAARRGDRAHLLRGVGLEPVRRLRAFAAPWTILRDGSPTRASSG